MTLRESARDKAIWTAQVVSTFVVFGGLIGGAVIGVGFPLIAVLTRWPLYFDPAWLIQFPMFVAMAAAYGIVFGAPPSILTVLAYLVGPKAMRARWTLTAFGVAASVLWSALVLDMMTSTEMPLESFAMMAAIFATCGAIATLACFSLLRRWNLHRPC